MNARISETIKAENLKFSLQILEVRTQRKYDSI